MTAFVFKFDDTSVDALLKKISAAFSATRSAEFLAGPADEWFRKRVSDRFAAEGDDATGGWAPLAQPATGDYRERGGYGREHPINVRTGELRRWMETEGIVTTASETAAVLSLPGPQPSQVGALKFQHAQLGGDSYPARPVLAFNATDFEGVVMAYAAWFAETVAL